LNTEAKILPVGNTCYQGNSVIGQSVHFKNSDKNDRQTSKIAKMISGYWPVIWRCLARFSYF